MLELLLEPLLVWGERTVTGSDGQFDGTERTGVAVVHGHGREIIQHALEQVNEICRPCPSNLAAQKLAELRVLTIHRARDSVDVELLAGAYMQRLGEYPADVVVAACDAWSDREEFWPSWAELKAECDKRMRGRRQIRNALLEALGL